jgi:hypothetical protein
VTLSKELARTIPENHLLSEREWRDLGVQQSRGWVHYGIHKCVVLSGTLSCLQRVRFAAAGCGTRARCVAPPLVSSICRNAVVSVRHMLSAVAAGGRLRLACLASRRAARCCPARSLPLSPSLRYAPSFDNISHDCGTRCVFPGPSRTSCCSDGRRAPTPRLAWWTLSSRVSRA